MVFLRKDIFSLDDAKRFKQLVLDTCQSLTGLGGAIRLLGDRSGLAQLRLLVWVIS